MVYNIASFIDSFTRRTSTVYWVLTHHVDHGSQSPPRVFTSNARTAHRSLFFKNHVGFRGISPKILPLTVTDDPSGYFPSDDNYYTTICGDLDDADGLRSWRLFTISHVGRMSPFSGYLYVVVLAR